MYTQRELKDGTRVYFAKPSTPVATEVINALSQVLAQVSGIVEAHLPLYFAEGEAKPRLVLVIGVQDEAEVPTIIPSLAEKLRAAIPPGEVLEILTYEVDAIPAAVLATGTRLK